MEKSEIIMALVRQRHIESLGKCGTSIPDLATKAKLPFSEVKTELRELYKSNKVKVRKGINGVLIFKGNVR